MSKKAISASIRLLIGAGQAKPAPPVGPALGQAGLNIMAFCKDFNAATGGIKVRGFWYFLCFDGKSRSRCARTPRERERERDAEKGERKREQARIKR